MPRADKGLPLTERQMEVLEAFGRTGTVSGAAESLGISLQTTKNILHDTYTKLDVPGIAAALWNVFIEPQS